MIPVVTLGSDLIFQQLMAKDYQEQQSSLEFTTSEIGKAAPQVPINGADKPWWERLKDKATSMLPGFSTNYDAIKKLAEGVPEKIIKLIVIFLAQTIIIPIVLIWALYKVMSGIVRPVAQKA